MTDKAREKLELGEDINGLVVKEVESGSDAESKGIISGDVVIKVSQKLISAPYELKDEIDKAAANGKKSVLLLILRNGARRFVALSLDKY